MQQHPNSGLNVLLPVRDPEVYHIYSMMLPLFFGELVLVLKLNNILLLNCSGRLVEKKILADLNAETLTMPCLALLQQIFCNRRDIYKSSSEITRVSNMLMPLQECILDIFFPMGI